MKRLILAFLTFLLVLPMMAQTYLSYSPANNIGKLIDPDQYCVVLYSKYNDLVITVTNVNKPVDIKSEGLNADGLYEYSIYIDPDPADTHQLKIDVCRRGDVYTVHIVTPVLYEKRRIVGYIIEGVARPIRWEDQTGESDAKLDASLAVVELTTTIKDLDVSCKPELGAKITSKDSPGDNTKKVISIEIPVKILVSERKNLELKKKEYKETNILINKMTAPYKSEDGIIQSMPQDKFKAYDELDHKFKSLEKEIITDSLNLVNLGSIDLYAEGSNHLTIDIRELNPRDKKVIIVLPLTVEKFVSKYQGFVSEGGKLFAARKYKEAKDAYLSALKTIDSKDASLKPTVNKLIEDCDSCIRNQLRSAYLINELIKFRKEGTAKQQQTAQYASDAIVYLTKLTEYNPNNQFYTTTINKLKNLLEDMPLKIRFTMVEWLTLKEGNPLQNVEVWAYYGSTPPTPADLSSNKRFKKIIMKEPANYVQEGISDVNGKVELELDRKKIPTGFIFCPVDDQIKMVYKSYGVFMRQSTGNYLERQIRMKLYKRTNRYF